MDTFCDKIIEVIVRSEINRAPTFSTTSVLFFFKLNTGIKKYGGMGKLREMNLSLIKKNIVMEKSELFSVIIITFIK